MAFLGLRVPIEVAQRLSRLSVPGKKTSPEEMHITLLYFGDHWDASQVVEALEPLQRVAQRTQPFLVECDTISCFPPAWRGDTAIIGKVKSDKLHQLRRQLAEICDQHGIEYSKQYKTYQPHITLSYANGEIEDEKMLCARFTAPEMCLWAGEEMDDGIIVRFPFRKPGKHDELSRKAEVFEGLSFIAFHDQFYRS